MDNSLAGPDPNAPPTPNLSGMSSPMPSLPAPTAPTVTPQQANLAHSAMIGHGFKSLVSSMGGTTTQYQQTPDGPQPVQVPNSGNDFFKHILAGAILGAGAGAEAPNNAGSGYAGAGAGINAVHANDQQQQAERQKQAQLQFQNKQAADKAAMEANSADTENQVRKAQIAQANAETLKTNLLTQSASYNLHQQVADADKDRISTFTQAGVKPVFEDIPESQMNDIIKNRPGASTLDWRHTGVKTVLDANGNPTYQYTLSAYDPQQPLPLSKGTIDQWKKDGLFKYHPEYEAMTTPGKTLTVGQFTALDKQAQNYAGQTLAQTKNDLEVKHIQSQIDETAAAIKSHNAQAGLASIGIQEKRVELETKKALNDAFDHLTAVGNDPDKLTNPKDRIAIAKAAQPLLSELNSSIKTAEANSMTDADAKDSLPKLWAQFNTLSKLASIGGPANAAHAAFTVYQGKPIYFVDPTGNRVPADSQAKLDRANSLGYKVDSNQESPQQDNGVDALKNLILEKIPKASGPDPNPQASAVLSSLQ